MRHYIFYLIAPQARHPTPLPHYPTGKTLIYFKSIDLYVKNNVLNCENVQEINFHLAGWQRCEGSFVSSVGLRLGFRVSLGLVEVSLGDIQLRLS